METNTHRPRWKTLLAFAIIYFVWGSTFLAIRVGVREVPPLLLAAMRFLIAGLVLYGWMIARGERSPNARQWMAAQPRSADKNQFLDAVRMAVGELDRMLSAP